MLQADVDLTHDPYECEHEASELRHKRTAAGIRYAHQCLRCGRIAGNWIKASAVESFPPAWDEKLQNNFNESIRLERDAYWKDRLEMRRAEYARYLSTPEWRAKRAKVLQRDNWTCCGCGDKRATEVHHKSYERVGREMLFDLVSVCADCHRSIHDSEAH